LFSFLRHARIVNGKLETFGGKPPPGTQATSLVDERATELQLYSVSPLPAQETSLHGWRTQLGTSVTPDGANGQSHETFPNLVEIVRRALVLQRFRDATLERRMTDLHTRAMPPNGTIFFQAGDKNFIRTHIYPIEPERALEVNSRLAGTESEDRRRRIIGETVADGCRAAMRTMIGRSAAKAAKKGKDVVPCAAAVKEYRRRQQDEYDAAPQNDLPGTARKPECGPGLVEVCRYCALSRGSPTPEGQSLRVPQNPGHEWPAADAEVEPLQRTPAAHVATEPNPSLLKIKQRIDEERCDAWPRTKGERIGRLRPTVSMLFSGGVFRGVFQVGVLNALSELGLRPDVIAGASVGSITAAMVAATFSGDGAEGLPLRQERVRRLASAYLAMDRLMLTDRFSDFIRSITVRSAQTRFSLREADRVLRRLDAVGLRPFGADVRRVVAGIERLTYVSPFELLLLVKTLRLQRYGRAMRLIVQYAQELLDRAGVGVEALGAEPLERLIEDYVLKELPDGRHAKFGAFYPDGIWFLATATNMSQGSLEILGERQLADDPATPNLLNGLLASSAFPGVFRPRWSWELIPTSPVADQYIDGGVMDNLPLDAVAQFLREAAQVTLITARPDAPHLVFAASLRPATPPIRDERTLDGLRHNWIALTKRAQQLGYNTKLDVFARTQRNLRAIAHTRGSFGDWTPLDLEVVTVIPRWLCGTFAFHPMLGFRRERQAESIAHGCASTLREFGLLAADAKRAPWLDAWGLSGALPSADQVTHEEPFRPLERPTEDGNCWFRPTVRCPFSLPSGNGKQGNGHGSTGRNQTAKWLNKVYEACRALQTHLEH
jgi:predicted acylesterase/phospholipase RssA